MRNLEANESLEQVRAVRAPATEREFGEREGTAPEGEVELAVIESGESVRTTDPETDLVTYVVPLLNEESCLESHEEAAVGEVLGLASISVSTAEETAMAAGLQRNVLIVFGSILLVEILLLSVLLTRSVFRPIPRW
jgi:hypothetical protein